MTFSKKFSPLSVNPDLQPVTERSIKLKFQYLRQHYLKLEKIFQEEAKELQLEAITEDKYFGTNQNNEEHCSDYWIYLQELEFVHMRMHRYSAILALYSYLESSLQKLCFTYEKKFSFPVSVTELSGCGVERCTQYIKKVAGINCKSPSHIWENVETLNKVRNCIMHGAGDTTLIRSSNKLIKKITYDEDLYLIDKHLLMIAHEFIIRMIRDVEKFLLRLINENTNSVNGC